MNAADPVQELNAALARAQGVFPPIVQSSQVDTGKYRYSYAPLEVILAAVRPALADNGLAISQPFGNAGDGPVLRTELRHTGGGMVVSELRLGEMPDNPQAFGSRVTYLRRYAITALLGIATEEDDDGQAAARPKQAKGKIPAEHRPTSEQVEQLNAVLADLHLYDPDVDWTERAREIAGVPGEMLTQAGIKHVTHELGAILAGKVAEQGPELEDDIEF